MNQCFLKHLMSWCKLQIHAVGGPSDLMWVYITGHQARISTHKDS